MSSDTVLDGYDARLLKAFIEERHAEFLTHLQRMGESDAEAAAQDVYDGLDQIIESEE